MKTHDCPLSGLKLIELEVFPDSRGFFMERYNEDKFRSAGLPVHFVQDNYSRSHPRVVRGLHYQFAPVQGKLVGVFSGRIWDVAVDIRPNSPTYGQCYAIELSGENGLLLWIPPGFAHGFCVLGDTPADIVYKVTAPYGKNGEGGIRFDDPEFGIDWPVKDPIISDRDKALPTFADYKKHPPTW